MNLMDRFYKTEMVLIIPEFSNIQNAYHTIRAVVFNLELRQNIPFKEMNQLYAANDILVLPSKGESAGMVILEAMSQGLCVMSSINCGLASVLDEYECGFTFDIENPSTLAAQLDKLIANPCLIKEMGEKSVKVISENFLFANYKTELLKMIENQNEGSERME